ncbi:MAG: exodeoxyribonuclease VII small subunit [Actinobacteria bacterium 69-20]|jgi:exodeoxyribonuclease VII small subunit|nr:exodeoxyribonuclease VII small subunit [Actinomycetota bacterium]OJV28694.1 MAG: exodeoxyribonuclease VII small subunit [Actinobacteria bacterium 69-20]
MTPKSTKPPTAQPKSLPDNYEAARDELAAVVERLEAGGLSLDESLTLWERGQALAAACETFLAGARKRVDAALSGETAGDTAAEPAEAASDDPGAA